MSFSRQKGWRSNILESVIQKTEKGRRSSGCCIIYGHWQKDGLTLHTDNTLESTLFVKRQHGILRDFVCLRSIQPGRTKICRLSLSTKKSKVGVREYSPYMKESILIVFTINGEWVKFKLETKNPWRGNYFILKKLFFKDPTVLLIVQGIYEKWNVYFLNDYKRRNRPRPVPTW